MAGESPDRSKQRESSAEPTSGSAGPVPEARSESSDPRLAAAGAAVDTATRILSAKDLAAARGKAGQASDDTAGDEKLRAAVAAWVRSADEASDEGQEASPAGADDSEKETGADGSAETDGSETADGSGSGSGKAEDAADAKDAAEDADGPADARDSKDAEDAKGSAADAEGSGAGGTASEGGAEAADDADDATDAEDAKDAKGSAADAEGSGVGGTASEGGAEAADDADDATDAEQAADAREEAEDAEPEQGADAEDGAADAGEAGTDGRDDAGEPDADAKPRVDQPTAVFKAVRPPKPAVDQPTTMLKLGGAPKAKPGKPAESGEDAPAAKDKPAPAAPAKPGAPAEGKSAPAKPGTPAKGKPVPAAQPYPGGSPKEGKPAGEGDAERTSKFVALKPLDEPAAPKPKPAPADATAPVPQLGPERTTQQPLPPKPPLDLLAELTNTPPPPQTPLRTAVRRVKIWTPLVLLLVVVFAVVQSMRSLPAPTLQLTAEDSYSFDGGKVDIPWPQDGQAALDVQGIGSFGSSGEQKPVPIASVAKVMTAYVILRDHPLKSGEEGPMIKIDQLAEDQSNAGQESTVDVFAGDEISEREALESILIASANNVARLLARWDSGSEKDFVAKMNAAAKDLGMTNTTYTDPSGLNDTTVSTAVDQVKLAKAAMTQPAFREVAAMMSYDDYKGQNHHNWNELVGSNNVVGIKTGTTTSALGNLVFAAKKEIDGETRTIIGAVVRQPAGGPENTILSAALHQSDLLIRAAQDALEPATLLKKGDVVGYVDDGLGGRTPVVATKDVTAVGWAGLEVKLSFAADELPHTAKAGTEVGTLTVGDGATAGAVKVPVALQNDLVEPGFMDKVTRIG
ncbi:D-alanyl-D-alanine carboxypeptidase [Streptomyces sp. NPDC052610]|uniref:D-alanyl-D-alanine carboxypeptidase n=1 Tax=Streptomyces sp. NPDC052610 TaxID=3154952 RepID=UPI00343BEC39